MILLDTHALLWWSSDQPDKLSLSARHAITQSTNICASAISAWEIALLIAKGRIILTLDLAEWLDAVVTSGTVRFIPLGPEIAAQAATLPGDFHKDPADRMIVATARKYNAPLITADGKISSYPHVTAIW